MQAYHSHTHACICSHYTPDCTYAHDTGTHVIQAPYILMHVIRTDVVVVVVVKVHISPTAAGRTEPLCDYAVTRHNAIALVIICAHRIAVVRSTFPLMLFGCWLNRRVVAAEKFDGAGIRR